MSLLDSSISPVLLLITIFGVMAGFFKHTLVKVLIILAVEIAIFVLFPTLLVWLTEAVVYIRHSLG